MDKMQLNIRKTVEEVVSEKMDIYGSAIKENTDDIAKLSKSVDQLKTIVNGQKLGQMADNTASEAVLRANKITDEALDKKIEQAIKRISSPKEIAQDHTIKQSKCSGPNAKEENYDLCRRCIKIWPVIETPDKPLREAAAEFVHCQLNVPTDDLCESDVIDVRKVAEMGRNRDRTVHNEVLIVFANADVRDLVARHVTNLASHFKDKKPTAGVRMQVPSHLMSTFRLLSRHGHALRNIHGREFRRNVRFDDVNRDLYLSCKFKKEDTE